MNRRSFLKSTASLALAAGATPMLRLFAAPAAKSVVPGNTAFGLDFYGQVRGQSGNLFCSPFSISSALAMTSGGAAGDTLAEMTRALHLPADQAEVHAGFAALQKQLADGAAKGAYELNVANALWGQQGFPFREEFLSRTKRHYGAGFKLVDYGNPEAARQAINRWVEQQTKDKIKDLFARGTIAPDTRLVLANAIYFKGKWSKPFQKRATSDETFHAGGAAAKKVPTMHLTDQLGYAEGEDWQALQMGYAGGTLAMNVVLPRATDGLAKLEANLTPELLNTVLGRLRPERVIVSLPRFKMTWGQELTPVLAGLGMRRAFTPMADFSRMTAGDPLQIGVVVHKAFVDVNEEGTEAAGATGVGMKLAAAPVPQQPKVFKADHPFLMLIRDTATGSVLFLGRVNDPTA